MKGWKVPWVAAVLALALGGPGFFYLGWRRGAKATSIWLVFVSVLVVYALGQIKLGQDGTLEPAVIYFLLLQAACSCMAYRSCKRSNAETAKAGIPPGCSKKLKDIGVFVIVLSAFTLFGSVLFFVQTNPPMGEMGDFDHASTFVMFPMSAWGLATGIGLLRAWRWARISMLVFSGLLVVCGALGFVTFLFMPNGDIAGWSLFLIKAGMLLYWLIPLAIGVRWFIYFTRNNVKAHFQMSHKAPLASA